MAKTSAIITSTDPTTGKTLQKTLTDINPDASNEQIATFGGMLNAITGNGYVNTFRVDKVNCDLEQGGGKQTATITFTNGNSQPMSNFRNGQGGTDTGSDGQYQFTYNGDANLYCRYVNPFKRLINSNPYIMQGRCANVFSASTNNNYILSFSGIEDNAPTDITENVVVEVYAPETDNYKAASATFTLTV